MKFFGRYDSLILITVIFLIIFLLIFFNSSNSYPNKIVVEINGRRAYVFEKDGVYKIIDKGKELMKVEILNNKVRVLESTCPDKLCIKSGWLKSPHASIVCVPNKVIIYFENNSTFNNGNEVDAYTW